MYKQIIIARKDLNMSPGKLAAQVSHASMAFLTQMIIANTKLIELNRYMSYTNPEISKELLTCGYRRKDLDTWAKETQDPYFYADAVTYVKDTHCPDKMKLAPRRYEYVSRLDIEPELYEQWIDSSFTKCILEAKNRDQLMKAVTIAEGLGLQEGSEFFLIRDNCLTELEPEDEDGRTLTCIGFKPMDSKIINKVGKKFQLWGGKRYEL